MILITGNAGFIGTYLTGILLEKGHTVRGIDIRPRKDNLHRFMQIEGNILDRQIIRQSMINVETVIHLAAEHKDFGITEADYYRVNELGTKVLLDEASHAGIKKFIFYSSVAVYGAQSHTTEETTPAPDNPYGASKLAAEQLVAAWAKDDPSRTAIIIRPTVIFGANSKANIFRLIRQVCDGRFLMVGKGENIKSVAYVENVVDATLFLMDRCSAGINIVNYADEPHLPISVLVTLIRTVAGKNQKKFYIPLDLAVAGGYVFDVFGKITRIDFPVTAARMKKFAKPTHHQAEKIRSMGFIPRYSIAEGLKRNIDWYLRRGNTLNEKAHSSD